MAQVVHRLATGPSRYPSRVLGPAFPGPRFPGVHFHPMSALPWLPLSATQRYVAALAPHLARLPPGPIEVHNKPDVALWLSRLFPRRPVSLFLHNDPTTMRGARSPAARARLLRRLAHVAAVSGHIRTRFLAGLSTAPRPVTVLHNAIDPATIPPILPQPARDPVLLFVGRIVADKGADLFVAACAQALPHLPGWRAEMIGADGFAPGQPDTSFIRALRPAAAAAGVTLLGAKPPHAVLAAMAAPRSSPFPAVGPNPLALQPWRPSPAAPPWPAPPAAACPRSWAPPPFPSTLKPRQPSPKPSFPWRQTPSAAPAWPQPASKGCRSISR